ncbi:RTA1-domain-containing protein [Annulohypoxylon maeteangense]|uniref:RTA1-domain-containing protein n=1 Tax=Annulohypoxylon maeteangense TaxID=1927788 RepID=UPI0020087D1C|nr:RTA1-domain-containing protein [Annulohypoxylon maeteangense]KAI0881950.1 RTA1-domain-containing protein [Annulohypoxylon maeteangense]
MSSEDQKLSFFDYDPSIPTAVVCCVLFGLTLIWSTFMTIRKRSWVWTVQLLAILMEVVGYAFRIVSANDPTSLNPYAVQFCVIILAPVLMAGAIYVVFGRIVFHVVPAEERTMRLLWIPPRWITPIFVTFDIVALLVQLIGAVSVSSTQATDEDAMNKLKIGKDIALAGLGIQMAAFGLFTVIAARFHFTSQRFVAGLSWRLEEVDGGKAVFVRGSTRKINPNWRHLLYALNASCILILIRSVFRVVEFAQGSNGSVMQKEFYMYVLDTLPIFLVVLSFCLFFPGSYLPFMGFRVPKNAANTRLGGDDSSATALQEI